MDTLKTTATLAGLAIGAGFFLGLGLLLAFKVAMVVSDALWMRGL